MNRQNERGFTLIETLVAFAILSVSLGLFYQTISSSAQNQRSIEKEQVALNLAKSTLAQVGHELPLKEGVYGDVWKDNYNWTMRVHSQPDPESPHWLYEVSIQVSWPDRGKTRALNLETLMLGENEGRE